MKLSKNCQLDISNHKTQNLSELLDGYKRYLEEFKFKNTYLKQLMYVRKNIPQVYYSLYDVKNESELINKFVQLYEAHENLGDELI
ncbi:hypothetical protein [Acinetobacter beijerinckii]|uniref:hypothetical protein n=1 Tax=Acinetobacter beijerinckii TaxID=262668 RepID=UPI0005EF4B2F|nr:hypothetical protein [Acinetobacter beijerinckii]